MKLSGKQLLNRFLKEKDTKNPGRIIRYSAVFQFWTNNRKQIEEMMQWAYLKGTVLTGSKEASV